MENGPKTRYSLIGQLQDPHNFEAWNEFADIYQPLILNICRKRGLQHADATDVTQDVLARVAKAINQFDGTKQGATFRGWLYRVTRNLVVDFFRRQTNRDAVLPNASAFETLAQDGDDAESREFRIEFQRQVFAVVASEVRSDVQPKTWQAFWRTEVDNEPVVKVASDLCMQVGAIYVARSRVIARLKKAAEARMNVVGEEFDV